MNILDIGRAHFAPIRSKSLGVITVDEWKDENGDPIKIYVRPLTMAEQSEKDGRIVKEDYLGWNISTLIYAACNEDMVPMFKDIEPVREILQTEFCPKVIAEINSKIRSIQDGDTPVGLGDLEKEKKN